ncbi:MULTISPECIES: serine/threonine-protein kinase [unclassified Methanoregula]|uniref:serine/threonine-protein kinase n=1 Tax=unclassified Methanoregula TaxID=2649730 RepID=UPI0009C6DAFD|nr:MULTISPECIES: serine/threonine-protein kinase [unclassified Methanoregula]OPX62045.1 MAG: serine/threonine-protein kinase [Methanoregula sp. PtaB.Bin085]OPY36578.1 MAG: serine/threonine-protein kinase [Methanoregula sp. PtaU1.Bin006]
MGSRTHVRTSSGRVYPGSCRITAVFLLLLFSVLLLIPAVFAGPSADPRKQPDPASIRTPTLVPSPAVTQPPTAEPARGNRTSLAQQLRAIDRPKVTLPSALFLLILAVAGIGLLAILYFLFRRWKGIPAGKNQQPATLPGNPTLVGDTSPPVPEGSLLPTGPAVLFPPSLAKRFAHAEFVGEGGLARVFRATNTKTGMTVAVKVPVRYDEATGTHFTRDIVNWQGLEHKNIIRIWSANILPVPYIEMEYAPSSLSSLAMPVPEERAVGLVLGIARGIAYAHDRGIVHRDIKPENILLSEDGTPKITDWGLAKALDDPRQSSMIGFSPSYAAPEQLAPHRFGRPGPATDIYQLGMLMCELLTGTTAFWREGMLDLTIAITEDEPVVPRWGGRHDDDLRSIILRCLEKRPEDRYSSVDDLIRDLEHVQAKGW